MLKKELAGGSHVIEIKEKENPFEDIEDEEDDAKEYE